LKTLKRESTKWSVWDRSPRLEGREMVLLEILVD
jgi:hypothetical protein